MSGLPPQKQKGPTHGLTDPMLVLYYVLSALIIVAGTIFLNQKDKGSVAEPQKLRVAIVNRDLPAYHIIAKSDVGHKTINTIEATNGLILNEDALVGRYSLTNLTSHAPIKESQVAKVTANTAQITAMLTATDTHVVAIPADNTLTLGGTLRPGDIVAIYSMPKPPVSPSSSLILEDVLVLDVRSPQTNTTVLIALSPVDWRTYLDKMRDAIPYIVRRIN